MLEGRFKTEVIKEVKQLLPGCLVLHLDPNDVQGISDLLILYEKTWAVLEGKKSFNEPYRPNQEYYLEVLDGMSFASMICPENKEAVLYELQLALAPGRTTRFSRGI